MLLFDEEKTVQRAAEERHASKKDHVAATTYGRYVEELEHRIFPEYGDTPISHVTDDEIKGFLGRIEENHKKSGKSAESPFIRISGRVISMHLDFSKEERKQPGHLLSFGEKVAYEPLDASKAEFVCIAAKHNETADILAAIHALYCGNLGRRIQNENSVRQFCGECTEKIG